MKSKKAITIMWCLSLLPFLLVALCWSRLPDMVPTHWGLDGQVNGWSPRWALWGLCTIAPLLSLGMQFLPRLDPKKENYGKFQRRYDLFGPLVPLLLLVCTTITLSESLWPGRINVGRTIGALVGLLFIVTGNLMGKVKSNWFMGFRTPWALSDPDVWNKTQRMGGWVFFLAGLCELLLSLLAPEKIFFSVFFVILLGGTALTCFMSWKWFRDKGGPLS